MAGITLEIIHRLVDRLTPTEQALLLAYLASKLAGAINAQASATGEFGGTIWDEFFAAGNALQDDPTAADQSMTAAVLSMRR